MKKQRLEKNLRCLLALFFQGKQVDAVRSTLRRLCQTKGGKSLLQSAPLDSQRVYYHLTSKAARLLGVSRDKTRPLGRQALCKRYGLLWFICQQDAKKRILFQPQHYPDLFPAGFAQHSQIPRHDFYFDYRNSAQQGIGYAVVDHGGYSERLIRKLRDKAMLFLKQGFFDDFLLTNSFEITLLTLSTEKQEFLERLITQKLQPRLKQKLTQRFGRKYQQAFPFQVASVPGLLPIIGERLR